MNSLFTILNSLVLLLATLQVSAQGIVHSDIDYKDGVVDVNGKDLLDVYVPDGAKHDPVLVFFHGGALRMGSKIDAQAVASRFVSLGIVVVTPGYRLSPGVMHPAHVKDAAAALAWVVNNIRRYGGDPGKIFVGGHSAGAYLAVLLALDPDHLGVYGLKPETIRGTIAVSPFLYVEETAAVRPKDVWGTDPTDWLAASVTPHIRPGLGPMLLIYADGDADWRKRQNETFAASMRARGNNVRVVEVPGRAHLTLISKLNARDDQIGDRVMRFIEENK